MRFLITGAFPRAEALMRMLCEEGHEAVFLQNEKDPLPAGAEQADGIIANGLFLSHPIEQFDRLRFIQLTSAGFDRVPMEYVRAHGITICNARGVYSVPMAEFAVSGVLQLYKEAAFFRENQQKHAWVKHRGLLELAGKRVCIAGCGSVGTECAARFRAFGCEVDGIDLYPREDSHYSHMYPLSELDRVLPEADILVLTLPLTEETRGMMNGARFDEMQRGAVLVNIARGAVVDRNALIGALNERKLGGAVLDVFDEEPLDPGSPLWDMERVLITPHNSFVGENNAARLLRLTTENVRKWINEDRGCVSEK